MKANNTWPIKQTNRKTVATPRTRWIVPSQATEKGLVAHQLKLDQMRLDIRNKTIELMENGWEYELAKEQAHVTIDPNNTLKPFLNFRK